MKRKSKSKVQDITSSDIAATIREAINNGIMGPANLKPSIELHRVKREIRVTYQALQRLKQRKKELMAEEKVKE